MDSDELRAALENVNLSQDYTGPRQYSGKMEALNSMILTHKERGTDRDVFFLQIGSWDHHEALKPSLSTGFQNLNNVLTLFEQEMKDQGLWDQVTMVITSDFARTLTANSGEGSDHAWGGNYFLMGGSVKGGIIHGDYPSDITPGGPLNVGRGRLIPTLSWESPLNAVVQWMGVNDESELDYCMPNRKNTGAQLFSKEDMFEADSARTLRGTK